MPNLIKFYEQYRDLRDRFEIIAFHDYTVRSIAEAYKRLSAKPIIREKWGVDELPFPVLLDNTLFTIEGWGIEGFPTTVLVDPEGNLVEGNAEDRLGEELRRLINERKAAK